MITYKNLGQRGRIGNQMFQLATLVSIGSLLNYEINIPKYSGMIDGIDLPDTYPLPGPNFGQRFYKLKDGFDLKINTFDPHYVPVYEFTERSFSFDKSILDIKDETNLNGHFQSEKYFIHNRENLLKMFSFKDSIKTPVFQFLDRNKLFNDFTTVHVRRTDYIENDGFCKLTKDIYYNKALTQFNTEPLVFISDDIEYCKTTFPGNLYYETVVSPFGDMFLMSIARYNIIANSTFSWWGAWLNKNSDVICPNPFEKWFTSLNCFELNCNKKYESGVFDMKDFLPEQWITI